MASSALVTRSPPDETREPFACQRRDVRDNGAGTPDGTVRAGAGLMNMRDRLATLTGDVQISSTPGVGTTVSGRVPTRAQGGV